MREGGEGWCVCVACELRVWGVCGVCVKCVEGVEVCMLEVCYV